MGNTLASPFRPYVESPVKLTSPIQNSAHQVRGAQVQTIGAKWRSNTTAPIGSIQSSPPFRIVRNKCAERRLR